MPIPPTDKTGFDHTTYHNLEERITTMVLHDYWDYIMQQMENKDSHLRKHLNQHDAEKLAKEGPINCLMMTLNKNSEDIQNNRIFSQAIGK